MPYNAQGKADYPSLLRDINRATSRSRRSTATSRPAATARAATASTRLRSPDFNSLERPLVWVPGDNDWTDCWGRYGPATRRSPTRSSGSNHERQLFTSTSQSLGQKTLTLTRESSEGGQYSLYSENVRWSTARSSTSGSTSRGRTTTIRTTTSTRYPRTDAEIQRQQTEEIARKAANLHWLDEGFAYAKRIARQGRDDRLAGRPELQQRAAPDEPARRRRVPGLRRTRSATETLAFPGQVVLVHGDSHYFKVDKPLNASERQGARRTSRASRRSARRARTGCRRRSTRGAATCSRSSR